MIPGVHLRVARATTDLEALARFYRDGLGFEELGSFRDHEGFDGLMLGHPGQQYHLEFTHHRTAVPASAPGPDSLLVFYLSDPAAHGAAVERMRAHGYAPVRSHNPYWDRGGTTFEDPDGYRVVLYRGKWPS
jgi:catechol 2,3-dioxygenase-like lactoylglutathione lyase family enzyme